MQPAVESRRTEAMRSSPERTLLVFIHGVNFFDPKDVAAAMSSSRLAPLLAAKPILHVFNWDALVGFPFHHDNVNPKYVAQVGAGILNSAHLGFASAQCAGALGEKRQSFVELTAYVLQCLALVLPYVVLVAVGFRLSIVPITAALVAAVTGLLITVICAKGGAVWGWAGFRRMLLLYFWPWLHLLLLPVAVPLRLALQLALVTVAWLLVMLGMALIAHPYTIEGAEPPHTLFGSSIPYDPVSGFLFALLVTPLSWLLLKTVASILFRFLAPVAKVMSDIVRYIGLPGYRRRIVSTLRSEIESLKPSGAHLVFVTHSLGSVIAAECLLQLAHEVDGPSRVTLISMGSPLKRCFHRFFGAHFPSPTALAVGFAARWKRFQWCNVYRPWDFVGSGLGLPSSVGGLDVNTRQWGRVGPNSHTGYWADPVVQDLVRAALMNPPLPAAVSVAGKIPVAWRDIDADGKRGERAWRKRISVLGHAPRRIALALTVVLCILFLLKSSIAVVFGKPWREEIRSHGVQVQGEVASAAITNKPTGPGQVAYTTARHWLEYEWNGRTYKVESIEIDFDASSSDAVSIAIDPRRPRRIALSEEYYKKWGPGILLSDLVEGILVLPFTAVPIYMLSGLLVSAWLFSLLGLYRLAPSDLSFKRLMVHG